MIHCMGTVVYRQRGDKEYVYYVYYDEKRRTEVYCGLSSDPESDKKILQCKKNDLTKQKANITKELEVITKKIQRGT